jgi:branched-subunit amino acid transport protein
MTVPANPAALGSAAMRGWLVVILAGAATVLIKAAAPLLAGGRRLPPRLLPVLSLLSPALFAALAATQVFARGRTLILDERLGGLAAAMAGAYLRAPAPLVLAAAVAVTAVLRWVLR